MIRRRRFMSRTAPIPRGGGREFRPRRGRAQSSSKFLASETASKKNSDRMNDRFWGQNANSSNGSCFMPASARQRDFFYVGGVLRRGVHRTRTECVVFFRRAHATSQFLESLTRRFRSPLPALALHPRRDRPANNCRAVATSGALRANRSRNSSSSRTLPQPPGRGKSPLPRATGVTGRFDARAAAPTVNGGPKRRDLSRLTVKCLLERDKRQSLVTLEKACGHR